MAETWTHPDMPGLIVHPADFQSLERVRRAFPQQVNPMSKAVYAWGGSDDPAIGPPTGFPMAAGEQTIPPFSLTVDPWIATFDLRAWGMGATGVPHSTPAFMVQARFYWSRLLAWTSGPLPANLFDLTIGAIQTLWTDRAVAANEMVQNRLNIGIRNS